MDSLRFAFIVIVSLIILIFLINAFIGNIKENRDLFDERKTHLYARYKSKEPRHITSFAATERLDNDVDAFELDDLSSDDNDDYEYNKSILETEKETETQNTQFVEDEDNSTPIEYHQTKTTSAESIDIVDAEESYSNVNFQKPTIVEPITNNSKSPTAQIPLDINKKNSTAIRSYQTRQQHIKTHSANNDNTGNELYKSDVTLSSSPSLTKTDVAQTNADADAEVEHSNQNQTHTQQEQQQNVKSTTLNKPAEEYLILYVTGFMGDSFKGEMLYNTLDHLDFKLGKWNIFHRHTDSLGNGPVLFSLCNMVEPATFNLQGIQEFKTPGIALFMIIPSYGDSQQNFKMMLEAAQQIAESNNGQVLDENKHILTPEMIKKYKDRIKAHNV